MGNENLVVCLKDIASTEVSLYTRGCLGLEEDL